MHEHHNYHNYNYNLIYAHSYMNNSLGKFDGAFSAFVSKIGEYKF